MKFQKYLTQVNMKIACEKYIFKERWIDSIFVTNKMMSEGRWYKEMQDLFWLTHLVQGHQISLNVYFLVTESR